MTCSADGDPRCKAWGVGSRGSRGAVIAMTQKLAVSHRIRMDGSEFPWGRGSCRMQNNPSFDPMPPDEEKRLQG